MKFSYSLLKRLYPRTPQKETLAERLNVHAFEVESIEGDTIDIKLYANRYSDAASHIGMAREIAAIAGVVFESPVEAIINPPEGMGHIAVSVADPKECPRYSARCFEIKKVGESPKWMQSILLACGIRPINHVVDLMNYVMLETGQPLHAFDFDRLHGKGTKKQILVRRAKKGESITTLDGQRFALTPDTLVIADAKGPLALAGIKGGMDSGVHAKTTKIVVEAANFDAVSVYGSARRLKLLTDAGIRFGHGLSPELAQWGMDRVTELLTDAGAELIDSVDIYPRPVGDEVIEFSVTQYEKLVGASLSVASAKKCFSLRGFEAEPAKDKQTLLVRVPAWRTDIESFEDLAEEVGRLEGYNSLKPQPPQVSLRETREEGSVGIKHKIRAILPHYALSEVYSSSFTNEKEALANNEAYWLLGKGIKFVPLQNPISEEKAVLRTSLLPALLLGIENNARFFDRVGIFEVGSVFGDAGKQYREMLSLGIALGAKKDPRVSLELKGIVSDFFHEVGLQDFDFIHQEDGVLRIESDHAVLGFLQERVLPKQWNVAIIELNAEKLLSLIEEEREYAPLPKYPSVVRDISVLASQEVRIGEMIEAIQDLTKLIDDVDLVDEYTDESLSGKQSLTFRIVFQAENRTLTDEEVNREMERIIRLLQDKFGSGVR